MTTLLPLPKRLKLYHGVAQPEPPKVSPNVVVEFVHEHDGMPIASVVNFPANVAHEGLEALINQLRTKDDDGHVSLTFHVALPEKKRKPNAPTRIVISKSIELRSECSSTPILHFFQKMSWLYKDLDTPRQTIWEHFLIYLEPIPAIDSPFRPFSKEGWAQR
ncbi:hypothetical protein M405DRAFT_936899 [Rhizopogon salebrosus TDB-379]|nr:hypothetical protein M405DRAFT_936899 [Rhizopogon salebrosus TDB-379]